MSIGDLFERTKTYLEHSDFSQYDSNMLFNPEDENIACSVSVDKIEYALSRIRVPNTEASYYYIPSLAFYGDVVFTNKSPGEVYHVEEGMTLVTLNAVDGSIINDTNQ